MAEEAAEPDAITEIRNASHMVQEESTLAMVELFGSEAEAVKRKLIEEMGGLDAGKFTIGLVVGAKLVQNRVERARAREQS